MSVQEDDESSSRYPRSESGADPVTAKPTISRLSLHGERPLWVCQPLQAVNRIDFERAEIPESPVAILGCSTVNVSSRHSSNGDSGGGSVATTTTTDGVAAYTKEDSSIEEQQDQVKVEQEPEGAIGDGSHVLESSLVSTRQNPQVVQGYYARTHTTSPILLPARELAYTEIRSCVSIQDITFLRDEGQREATGGSEYQLVTKMWLRSGAGIPSDLLHDYRRDVARQARLITLRTRGRRTEEAGVVKVKRCAARKKVRQAQV